MPRHRRGIFGFILEWIAKLLYFASLSSLIPFGAMILTQRPDRIPQTLSYLPLTALGLLIVSAALLLAYHKSLAHTIAALGWMTLIPGIGALAFMIVNRQAVLDFFAKTILGFEKIEPYVAEYLDNVLPKVWLFVIAYVIIGLVLLQIAGRIGREHSIWSRIRRLLGLRRH
ncbi:MAG: hypothetical protein QXM31_00040 [Candidatus Woesearchaeota archaeon]